MDYLLAVFAAPVLVLALSLGVGLVVDRVSGGVVPAALILPLGFAGLIVLSQLGTMTEPTAPLSPVVVVVVALAGIAVGRARLRKVRDWGEALGVTVIAYVIAASPVIFAGRPTMPGFLLDSITGTHLGGAAGLLQHGQQFPAVPDTVDANQVRAYFDNGYPSGGHSLLGTLDRLVPTDMLWLYAPYLSIALALVAPALLAVATRAGMGIAPRIIAAVVGTVPALTFSYLQMGELKEIAALPCLMVMAGLVVAAPAWDRDAWRAPCALAVAGAAGIASIGFAAAAWVALSLAIALWPVLRGAQDGIAWRPALRAGAVFAGFSVLLLLPVLVRLQETIRLARALSQDNTALALDLGNLFNPLPWLQAFGVWLSDDHRFVPTDRAQWSYMLLGLTVAAFLIGVGYLVRRGPRTWLAWTVGTLVIWWLLVRRGTTWTDAKVMAVVGPTLVFTALLGGWSLGSSALGRRRPESWALTGAVVVGVLWSAALTYHMTNLLPTDRYRELIDIGEEYAGQGPAMVTDFDEYAFEPLRDVGMLGLGYGYAVRDVARKDGEGQPYGWPVDLDELSASSFDRARLIIARRSPQRSRPPSHYQRVAAGPFYDVWRRAGAAPIAHVGLQSNERASARVSCSKVRTLAAQARRVGGHLLAAVPPPVLIAEPAEDTKASGNFVRSDESVSLEGPGQLSRPVRVPRSGEWEIWLRGSIGRDIDITVDGRAVGRVGRQSGDLANVVTPVRVQLAEGVHQIGFRRGGGSPSPGDGGASIVSRIVLQPADAQSRLVRVPPAAWRTLCDRRLDWIEVVAGETDGDAGVLATRG